MTAQEIINIIREDDGQKHGHTYGLRSCSTDAQPGDILPVSINWDASETDEDGEYDKPEYQLDGSSAVMLGDWLTCTEDLDECELQARMDAAVNYPGAYWYLVRGVAVEYGNDENEVVLSANGGGQGAEVVAVL